METEQFYPMDIEYKIIQDKPMILIYGRTIEYNQICVVDEFEPYFWVQLKEENDFEQFSKTLSTFKFDDDHFVTRTELKKRKILGKETNVVKVYVNIPTAIPKIRDEIKNKSQVIDTFEFDIPFTRRYLIDKAMTPCTLYKVEGENMTLPLKVRAIKATKIEQSSDEYMKSPKILAVDIETYNKDEQAVSNRDGPILMIALHGDHYDKVITWKHFKTDNKNIEFVKSEAELLERFMDIMNKKAPDIITGYFSDGFDLPYIYDRAKKYKIDLNLGLDHSPIKISGRQMKTARISGIVHLDIYKFAKNILRTALKTDSYTLDNVAKELIGQQKDKVDIKELHKVWDNSPQELEPFCKYNLQDARITYELCEKLLPNMLEFVKLVGVSLYETTRMSLSNLVEAYLLKRAFPAKELAPNNPQGSQVGVRMAARYQGGFVYAPEPGFYHNIAVCDFRSLYPTVIASHNISPEVMNCECCEGQKLPFESDVWFCTKKKGFISSTMEELITRRMRVKEIMKANKENNSLLEARQMSLKLLANSFYGYLGFYAARWYSFESAKTVTAWARYYITNTIKNANQEGYKVIYSDTDSVFLLLGDKTVENVHEFVRKQNKELPGIIELEFEGLFKSGLFVSLKSSDAGAKKRYALLDENDEMVIKGFEVVRRNFSKIGKEVQKTVLDMILKENDPKKAFAYIKGIIKDLRSKKIELSKVIIRTQITKELEDYEAVGPHVAVAAEMRNKGMHVGPGSVIEFVVTEGAGKIRDKARIAAETKQGDYDAEYYIENQIIPSVKNIMEVFHYDVKELVQKDDQQTLSNF